MKAPAIGTKVRRYPPPDPAYKWPRHVFTVDEVEGNTVHLTSTHGGVTLPLEKFNRHYAVVAVPTKAEIILQLDRMALGAGLTSYTSLRDTLEVVQSNYNEETRAIMKMAMDTGTKGMSPDMVTEWDATHAETMRYVQGAKP